MNHVNSIPSFLVHCSLVQGAILCEAFCVLVLGFFLFFSDLFLSLEDLKESFSVQAPLFIRIIAFLGKPEVR